MEKSRVEIFVKSLVKKQALRIIYHDLKKFNHYLVHYASKKVFLKENFKTDTLYYTVAYYYKKEKNRIQKKYTRIKENKTILSLKNKYPNVDIELLAYYINLTEILNFKTTKHYEYLEEILKIVLGLAEKNDSSSKYKNYKYIKKLQDKIEIVDVNYLACFLNEIKGYNFKSKKENEHLENIIKIILHIPIAISNKIKLYSWQLDIKIDMQKKHQDLREIIENNLQNSKLIYY
jgi:hypothetical protein